MYLKPALFGILAAFGLLGFYWIVMSWLSGPAAAREQFQTLWPYMIPLAGGFGTQVGLFSLIKSTVQTKSTITAGGTSAGVGMLACCAHHATDVLPFVGLAGLSIFLLKYQIPILLASMFINLIGVFYMLKHLGHLRSL